MKRLLYVVPVLVLLSTGCKKEEALTDTAATDASLTANERRGPRTVTVEFDGLVCHVWDKQTARLDRERAIVVRTPQDHGHEKKHAMTITLPKEAKDDLASHNIPAKCGAVCDVPIDALAFRLADLDGEPLTTEFERSDNFKDFVPRLTEIPMEGNPFTTSTDSVIPQVISDHPQSDSTVAGWFDLAGGKGDATKYVCNGNYEGHGERPFVRMVTVTFNMSGSAKLQVLKAGETDWTKRSIRLPDRDLIIQVKNDAVPPVKKSHFDMYAGLARKDADLTDIKTKTPDDCVPVGGRDGVPGCSNSAWP